MALKHAVLALVAERRGYGYELAQRFRERVGPGWQLNPSAVYPALDQLERAGLVTAASGDGPVHGGTERSPRVRYAATPAGAAALDTWLRTVDADPEPVRSELHLKLAFAAAEHREALVAQLAARERTTAELLARCEAEDPAAGIARRTIDAAVTARLRADVAWLREAQARLTG